MGGGGRGKKKKLMQGKGKKNRAKKQGKKFLQRRIAQKPRISGQ